MATSQDNFALDWIKGELFETLNDAREALDAYVESARDETRMRACLTSLHQVHGTLVMLELEGVTLLADHLERLAQDMLNGKVEDESAASQTLMQGILELPGHIEELQQGQPDTVQSVIKLVNEAREHLGQEALGTGVAQLGNASDSSLSRFEQIEGVEKARKIRAAYQQVLLSILKGEDLTGSLGMLAKVAQGLERICAGTPHVTQWQAFAEFIASLQGASAPLPSDAVKLLRRVDSEIRLLAQEGVAALKKPVVVELVQQLVDASRQRGRESDVLNGLAGVLSHSEDAGGLQISGRQALASAAGALREELVLVKDQLDLSVRSERGAPEDLVSLIAPLKQIGSTLSLLGFESSKSIVSDQVEILNRLTEGHALDQPTLLSIASALVQVDENLASFTQGGKGEVEKITDDAARAVTAEARQGLEEVKQSIVDFVSSKWDPRHLESTHSRLASICGALDMIPLARASRLLASCGNYIATELAGGREPSWEELDHLADAISGVDYYLERLAEENSIGADDILELVDRSLQTLGISEAVVVERAPAAEPVIDKPADVAELTEAAPEGAVEASSADESSAIKSHESQAEPESQSEEDTVSEPVAELPDGELPEPKLEMDDDPGFDLGNVEAGVDVAISDAADETTDAPLEAELEAEPAIESVAATASAATNPSLADTFETDEEIVEIFVEEVDEVLEAIAEWLPQWRSELQHEEALAEVRRAFHTLKGSGRIVGANIIGELAWSVENMLNRIIDGTVQPTEQFVSVVEDARALVPGLRDAFEVQRAPELDALGAIMERADVLASGGSLEDAAAPLADTDSVPETSEEENNLRVFLTEAAGHMAVLNTAIVQTGVVLNAESLRALHTLAGSAGMAGIEAVAALSRPVYELAQALRPDEDTTLTGDHATFFSQAYAALDSTLDDLGNDRVPEEHAQLIADADHLLVSAAADPELEARSEARDRLLGLEGLSVVMDASEFLQNWYEGALDLQYSDKLADALSEVALTARETAHDGIADLAASLAATHECLADDVLREDARQVLDQGHEQLLALFDSLAADESLAPVDDVIGDLQALVQDIQAEAHGAAHGAAQEAEADEVRSATGDVDQVIESAEKAGASKEKAEAPEDELEDILEDSSALEELADAADPVLENRTAALGGQDYTDPDNVVAFPRGDEPGEPEDEVSTEDVSLDDLDSQFLKELKEDATKHEASGPRQIAEPPAEDIAPASSGVGGAPGPAVELDPAVVALLPEDLDEEILEVFFEEADEILEALDENVHQWTSESGNRLYLEHLLRGLHTLKGGARLAGLVKLGDVTHQLESYLIEFQTGDSDTDSEFFGTLASRFDELGSLLAVIKAAMAGEAVSLPDAGQDVGDQAESGRSEEPGDADVMPPAPEVVSVPAQDSVSEIAPPPAADEPAADKTAAKAAVEAPAEKTERSSQEMVRVGSGLLENLVNLAGESSIVRARIEQGMSDFTSALDEMETTIGRVREQLRRLEIETEAQILFRQDRPDGPSYAQFDPLEMDRYSQLQQLSRGLSESASDMLDLKETLLFKARESETLLLQQARINTELQEGLMRTRMVPFSRLLPRLRRIVRQVSGELGKEVEFHALNAEGELDRNLLERMVPPLEHMLRNAVDHGIESKELRANYGKPTTGRIDLRLSREGGDVVIEISDDGSGIDVESVRAKAVERGLMAEGASLRDDEICQFVLAPGFTTAKSVTQISGRGVGMDVVHSEVKQLGGSIQIASRQGKGTRFIVRVPFTVSVNRALMVSVSDDYYAIPLNTIEGIVLLTPAELERLYAPDGNTFEYAGIPYRVRYLGHYLGREFRASSLQSSVPVVLVRSGDHAVAVHVDGVQGSREIVVKSLGPQFAGVGGISGATILGDGSVVVILDLLALIRAQSSSGQSGTRRPVTSANRTRSVMVVDDSVTVRKVTSRLLERQGMDVIVAKDGIEAISLLQERRPDVMLLDIEMPRMDGFEVARQVRHDDRLADLPIIMISSRTGEKHQEHAAQLGVNSFLGKPFQENELLATIDRLVN
jgi:chemosensory pili system protein ChpA (sensor histidine kinase/response regulator)